jgi:hypothetical protein
MGVHRAPVLCLLGDGRPVSPSLLDEVWNYLIESSIMAHHGDGVLLRVEPMKAVPELQLLGEWLRPPK